MLNRALRLLDADLLVKMGFLIRDLHRQIEELHQRQFGDHSSQQRFTVYRGQGMDKEAYNKMVANKGGLISFNNFLSTSKVRSTSLDFALRALTNDQMVGVLFVMNIDPARSSTPFASVVNVAYFGKIEDEVLFSMHSVFHIGEITPVGENTRLFQVQLYLASDKDNDLRELIDYIRKETRPDIKGWYRLGLVLGNMGEFVNAERVYEILLRQETNVSAKEPIYHQLGLMKKEQEQYLEAIAYYKKSIEIEEKQIPRDDLSLAMSYNYICIVYDSMGDYLKALSFHEKALAIRQQSLPPTHPDLATSYNNIGLVYSKKGDYLKALSSHENALAIHQQSLSPIHSDLAMTYNNISIVYDNMGDYPRALSSYEKTLAIKQQSLPPTHPSLASTYNNMGLLHEDMGNYSKAHSCFKCAVDIAQHSLPAKHPQLLGYQNKLASIEKKL